MADDIKISTELLSELESKGIKSSVEGLIDFKSMVEEFFTQGQLTKEMKEKVSRKMEKLTNTYLKIKQINLMDIGNSEKLEKIMAILADFEKKELDAIQLEIDKVSEELQDILFSKVNNIKQNLQIELEQEIVEVMQVLRDKQQERGRDFDYAEEEEEKDEVKIASEEAKEYLSFLVSQKMDEIKKILAEFGKDGLIDDIQLEIAEIEAEYKEALEKQSKELIKVISDKYQEKFDREADIAIKILEKGQEDRKRKLTEPVKQSLEQWREYAESTKSTVGGLQTTALTQSVPKKSFVDRFVDIITENPENDWIRHDIERDGKHIVIYQNENGIKRSEYEVTGDAKKDEKSDKKAKSFGFFSRIKAMVKNDEEKKIEEETIRKKEAIDKEIGQISNEIETTMNQVFASIDKRIEQFHDNLKNGVKFKQLLEKLAKNYPWAEEKSKILKEKIQEIAKKINERGQEEKTDDIEIQGLEEENVLTQIIDKSEETQELPQKPSRAEAAAIQK